VVPLHPTPLPQNELLNLILQRIYWNVLEYLRTSINSGVLDLKIVFGPRKICCWFISLVVQKIQQSDLAFCNLALSYFDESASLNI